MAATNFPTKRPRRLRQSAAMRSLVSETKVTLDDLILPLFIRAGSGEKSPIASMPGHYQLTLADLDAEIADIQQLGIKAILVFGLPAHKDALGSDSYSDHGIMQQAIAKIKTLAPELLVISDICLCEYTDHGHCGVIKEHQGARLIANDATLPLLAKQAVSHAQAGADVVAPSGMMDGMVQAIRAGLNQAQLDHVPILSYSTKFCSSLYGPFREATDGAPQFGDRRSYQMDPANGNEALRESELDVLEGADMLMVKPASYYLDIIWRVKQTYPQIPMAAYQVSGEFAMIKAASQKGWLDEKRVMHESLLAIKRAGADMIITYFAKEVARGFLCV